MSDPGSELIIYMLVRKDLKMGKGKIAAQCGHAVQELIMRAPKDLLAKYCQSGSYPKICLAIKDEEQMDQLTSLCHKMNVLHHRVKDEGRTQIESGTHTVLGIGPISKKIAQDIVGELKLL